MYINTAPVLSPLHFTSRLSVKHENHLSQQSPIIETGKVIRLQTKKTKSFVGHLLVGNQSESLMNEMMKEDDGHGHGHRDRARRSFLFGLIVGIRGIPNFMLVCIKNSFNDSQMVGCPRVIFGLN